LYLAQIRFWWGEVENARVEQWINAPLRYADDEYWD